MSFDELAPLHLPPLNGYDLIELALMHKSYISEAFVHNPQRRDASRLQHRRLAHLGDSIMNAAVTDYLFEKFPDAAPGTLSETAKSLKERRKGALAYAHAVGLDRLSSLGNSINEQAKQGDMFGEMFEALIGAIYLSSDRDFGLTRDWFQTQCAEVIERQLGSVSYD